MDDDWMINMWYWLRDVLVNVLFVIQLYSEKYIYVEGDELCPIQKLRVIVTQHRLWKFGRLCSYG